MSFKKNREDYEKILVISDTHNNPQKVQQVMKVEEYVDRVLHLGDLQGCDAIIKKYTNAPLEAVRGNCDDYDWPGETLTQIGDHVIFMTHGHRYGVNYGTDDLEKVAYDHGADVVLYGHTHVPLLKKGRYDIMIANPGSLANPRQHDYRPTYMIIWLNKKNGNLSFDQKVLI